MILAIISVSHSGYLEQGFAGELLDEVVEGLERGILEFGRP
jgi:hypothetical protein